MRSVGMFASGVLFGQALMFAASSRWTMACALLSISANVFALALTAKRQGSGEGRQR